MSSSDNAQETAEEKKERERKFFSKLLDEPDAVKGVTVHTRHLPVSRGFSYPLYMFKFDCRYPPSAQQGWGYSRDDHFGDSSVALDTAVRAELKTRLGLEIVGRIDCTCHLSFLGYAFNPFTPYFAYDEFDHLVALLIEVHNTPWGERCLYAMKVAEPGTSHHNRAQSEGKEYSTLTPAIHEKVMHVSPFHPPPAEDRWYYKFSVRGRRHITIEVFKPRSGSVGIAPLPLVEASSGTESEKEELWPYWDPNQDERRFTSTWDFTQDATHDVFSGSLRTVLQVYKHAASMLLSGKFKFYWYQPPLQSLLSSHVASWLLCLLPAFWLLYDRGSCVTPLRSDVRTGIALIVTGASMAIVNITSWHYIFLVYVAVASALYVIVSFVHFLEFLHIICLFVLSCVLHGGCYFTMGHGIPISYYAGLMAIIVVNLAIRAEICEYPGQ